VIPRLTELQPATDVTRRFLAELGRRGFSGERSDDLATRVVGATDNSIYQILPQAIVYPRSAADVALVFQVAQQADFEALTFTARGGGTGTNGQSLTSGLIVDVGRHMNHIGTLDLAAGWVECEPGVVLDELNTFLAPHGVFFAPNLSPSSRATIGGMVSTDASGQGSRVHGKTSEHVLALDVVLVDGSLLSTRPMPQAHVTGRAADALAIVERERDAFIAAVPQLRRFVTGYDLVHAYDPTTKVVDIGRLFCGAEGTLGVVVKARLRLTPIAVAQRLVALEFPTFDEALASASALVSVNPSSIETIDDKVMALAREDVLWDAVKDYLGADAKALNLVELEDVDVATVERRLDAMLADFELHRGEPGWPAAWKVAANEGDRKALWQLRAKGVGLLGNTKGRRKPVPFVEDTVVPPEHLAAYVSEFRALLEAEGLTYGMFGHVDVGCLHVRPALDLRDPEDEKRVRRISDRVAALCDKYGGVIWGEHGKGFRSEYSPLHFGAAFPIIQQIKALFDPENRLNPGKIATPGPSFALPSIDQPTRGQHDRHVARPSQDDFTIALDCNGNGQCYSWDPDHVMCPSSKVTRDRIHSPKGRAGVMREWLRQLSVKRVVVTKAGRPSRIKAVVQWPLRAFNSAFARYDYSRDVHRAMDGCLACKACATQCPVKVDVPSFRAHFLEQYHTRYLRKPADVLVAGLERALTFMAKLPLFFNFFFGMRWFQRLMGALVGLVDTPKLARPTLAQRMRRRGLTELDFVNIGETAASDKTVYLLQDAFTTFYEPSIVLAARDLLEVLGWRPVVVPFFVNGKGLHVKGFLGRFDRLVQKNVRLLARLAATGRPIVGIDPAVVLTYRDEYPATLRAARREVPRYRVELLQEFLVARLPKAPSEGARPKYKLFGHCTEKTLALASQRQWAAVFLALGLDLELVDAGCCGMSGAFGHEQRHQDESKGIFAMSWARWLPREPEARARVVASGYSCRSQVKRLADFVPKHPAEVLVEHLARTRAMP